MLSPELITTAAFIRSDGQNVVSQNELSLGLSISTFLFYFFYKVKKILYPLYSQDIVCNIE
jgi:hypothetical protein